MSSCRLEEGCHGCNPSSFHPMQKGRLADLATIGVGLSRRNGRLTALSASISYLEIQDS